MTVRVAIPRPLAGRAFTTAEGLATGLSKERLRGKDLQRPFRGVLVHTAAPLTLLDRCAALQRRLPDHAFFCGTTAAALVGVPLPAAIECSNSVHVGVPSGYRAPTGRNVKGHSYALNDSDLRVVRGLRMCTAERLWCELGEHLSIPDLVAAGDHLIYRRNAQTSAAMLRDALANYQGRRGRRRLEAALELLSDRSESPQESRLRAIIMMAGVDGIAVNLPITTTGGHRYRADLAIPRARLIIEYQGDIHRSVEAFRADMTRVSRLEADGWRVMFDNADDLQDETELVTRIRRYQPIG